MFYFPPLKIKKTKTKKNYWRKCLGLPHTGYSPDKTLEK